ncbi:hypothetical protein IAQ61_001584 [Plenodomus lingam]|uniref:uncharacterized protein n=1 Tax=Leptosphaeria maculans TaxID=5022 RepID=UPI00331CF54C|nr:hypothetical protein IAQ61_001584 [Plenodomus lingam]
MNSNRVDLSRIVVKIRCAVISRVPRASVSLPVGTSITSLPHPSSARLDHVQQGSTSLHACIDRPIVREFEKNCFLGFHPHGRKAIFRQNLRLGRWRMRHNLCMVHAVCISYLGFTGKTPGTGAAGIYGD